MVRHWQAQKPKRLGMFSHMLANVAIFHGQWRRIFLNSFPSSIEVMAGPLFCSARGSPMTNGAFLTILFHSMFTVTKSEFLPLLVDRIREIGEFLSIATQVGSLIARWLICMSLLAQSKWALMTVE